MVDSPSIGYPPRMGQNQIAHARGNAGSLPQEITCNREKVKREGWLLWDGRRKSAFRITQSESVRISHARQNMRFGQVVLSYNSSTIDRSETSTSPTMFTHVFERPSKYFAAGVVLLGMATSSAVVGQEKPAPIVASNIEIGQVRPDVYMIAGAGADIAVQIGRRGDRGGHRLRRRSAGARRDPEAHATAHSLHHQHQRPPRPRGRQRRSVQGGAVGDPDGRPQRDRRRRAAVRPSWPRARADGDDRAARRAGEVPDRRLAHGDLFVGPDGNAEGRVLQRRGHLTSISPTPSRTATAWCSSAAPTSS